MLGPTLFFLCINYISDNINSQLHLFADDCLVYRVMHTPQDHDILQQGLNNLTAWARDWHMEFNFSKCSILRATTKQNFSIYEYKMNDTTLNIASQHPYLGVTLDHKLSWHPHFEALCHKANCTLGFLKYNLYNLPMYLRERSYKQIILPMFDYCSSIWDPCHQNATNQLEMIQHRAARFVTNKPWQRIHHDSIAAILHELNWPTLQDRRKNNRLILFFKLVNNLLVVPHHCLPSPSFPITRANHQLKFSHYQARTEN